MQGFNMGRYVPPDQEGLTTGNKLSGKHPLGARARHLQAKGALVVRFEMPFAVWCTNCKPNEVIIGQGVRFNAEKKRVGNYYSTPIYSFRMKHTVCGGWIEIRTDPKNTAYVVTEGGRKRDTGEDKETGEPGEIRIRLGPGEREQKEKDAFARLEGKVEDKRQFETATSRIQELQKRQRRDWEDPYEQSKRLRRTFRAERKRLEKAGAANEALKDKMSLGIDLVEETEEDRLRVGLIDFGPASNDESMASRTRPMFETASTASPKRQSHDSYKKDRDRDKRTKCGKVLKSEAIIAERKALLRSELRGNTRAAIDPFLNDDQKAWQPTPLKMRKTQARDDRGSAGLDEDTPATTPKSSTTTDTKGLGESPAGQALMTMTKVSTALVNYGSDSE